MFLHLRPVSEFQKLLMVFEIETLQYANYRVGRSSERIFTPTHFSHLFLYAHFSRQAKELFILIADELEEAPPEAAAAAAAAAASVAILKIREETEKK